MKLKLMDLEAKD